MCDRRKVFKKLLQKNIVMMYLLWKNPELNTFNRKQIIGSAWKYVLYEPSKITVVTHRLGRKKS